jgi:hypothetical protein
VAKVCEESDVEVTVFVSRVANNSASSMWCAESKAEIKLSR